MSDHAARLSTASAVALVLLPKCPGCFAAYSAVLAALGLEVGFLTWLRPLFALGLIGATVYLSSREPTGPLLHRWTRRCLLAGGAVTLVADMVVDVGPWAWIGVAAVTTGAMLARPRRHRRRYDTT